MIDIHSHVLPMVDDGAESMIESASIFEGLAKLGYTRVVATPHWAVGMPDISRDIVEDASMQAADYGIELSVARECRIHPNLPDHVKRQDYLRIDGGKSVLVELPWGAVPGFTVSVFKNLLRTGYRPLLAHPERHAQLWEEDSPLDSLVQAGVLTQMNIASLLGHHGNGVRDRAVSLLTRGHVTMVGTDIHSAAELDCIVPAAHQLLRNMVGDEVASILTTHNPRAFLADQPVTNLASDEIELTVDTSWIKNDSMLSSVLAKLKRHLPFGRPAN